MINGYSEVLCLFLTYPLVFKFLHYIVNSFIYSLYFLYFLLSLCLASSLSSSKASFVKFIIAAIAFRFEAQIVLLIL